MKYKVYCIAQGISEGSAEQAAENLTNKMLRLMEEGWEPLGGVTHVAEPGYYLSRHTYSQALVMLKDVVVTNE